MPVRGLAVRRERARVYILQDSAGQGSWKRKKEVAKLKLGQRATNIVGETNMIGKFHIIIRVSSGEL